MCVPACAGHKGRIWVEPKRLHYSAQGKWVSSRICMNACTWCLWSRVRISFLHIRWLHNFDITIDGRNIRDIMHCLFDTYLQLEMRWDEKTNNVTEKLNSLLSVVLHRLSAMKFITWVLDGKLQSGSNPELTRLRRDVLDRRDVRRKLLWCSFELFERSLILLRAFSLRHKT